SYPVGTHTGTFVINDCVIRGTGDKLQNYAVVGQVTFQKVENASTFSLDTTFDVSSLVPALQVGESICNVAKTISSPSSGPTSDRKDIACYTVGGNLRVEKRDASTGNVIAANNPATFQVTNCVNKIGRAHV